MQKQQRFFVTLLMAVLLCMVWPPFACADVKTTTEGAGGSNAIYIAGNPNNYPVEYYDEKTKTYEGIMPALWEEVSNDTGLNFIYIQARPRDLRAQLAKNKQVEIVSGAMANESWIKASGAKAGAPILTLNAENNRKQTVQVVYTEICEPAVEKKIEQSLKKVTDEKLANIAVDFIMTHPVTHDSKWLWSWPLLLFCVLIVLIGVILRFRHYRAEVEEKRQIDYLTGIYNKAYFLEYYEKAIPSQYRNLYAIIYIAFNLAHVNENYGEEVTESQICFAADELKLSLRDGELVARVSAGGFGIIRFSGGEEEATRWTEEVLERLNTYHQYDERAGKDASAMFYGGIYMLEPSDRDCEKALFKAQKSYVKAWNTGVPCLLTRKEALMREAKDQALKREMLEGLRNGQFKMFLQFGVFAKDGTICGAEAFSRWDHPTRGLLHPASYIPLLEAQGSITELDFFIFEEACRTLEKWTKNGHAMVISCNFARMSIEQRDFVPRIEAIASKYTFERKKLLLEISESAMDRNHAHTFENITKCKAMGFSVCLDDVGSGVSDFQDFRYEAITLVKLDRALLNAAVTERGLGLLRGLVKLFGEMDVRVLVEGVETKSQWDMLQEMGVDYIQGYYFYHPLPLEEAERVLDAMETSE